MEQTFSVQLGCQHAERHHDPWSSCRERFSLIRRPCMNCCPVSKAAEQLKWPSSCPAEVELGLEDLFAPPYYRSRHHLDEDPRTSWKSRTRCEQVRWPRNIVMASTSIFIRCLKEVLLSFGGGQTRSCTWAPPGLAVFSSLGRASCAWRWQTPLLCHHHWLEMESELKGWNRMDLSRVCVDGQLCDLVNADRQPPCQFCFTYGLRHNFGCFIERSFSCSTFWKDCLASSR